MRPLISIPCKNGSLRLTPDGFLGRYSMTAKVVWRVPVQSVIGITEVSRKIMATILIQTTQGNHTVEWVGPADMLKLQQGISQAQRSIFPPNRFNPVPVPSVSSYGAPPQPPMPSQPSPQRLWQWYRAKRLPVQIVLAVATLFVCCAASSGVVQGITGSFVSPSPTPTQVAQASSSSSSASSIAPTAKPTSAPRPTPKPQPTQAPQPTLQPTPKPHPTQQPAPTPTPRPSCNAINNNPWCYNFSPGSLIYNPPANFCTYFNCIASFWGSDDPGDGYIVQCQDGTYSQSGGESGACSYHGGVLKPLYSH